MRTRRRLIVLAAGVAAGAATLLGAPAGAVDNPDYTSPPPTTAPESPTTTVTVQETVQEVRRATPVATPTTSTVQTRLAITGSDVTQLAAVGAVLVGAGGAVLIVRRRRLA